GVTVYPNSALVTREVDVPEGAGNIELVVTPLPPQTVDSSLYSEGTDGIRVLTTRYRMRPIKEDVREEVRKAEDELKKLQLASQKIEPDMKAVEQNIALVAKMENFTAATTQHSAEKGALNSESAIALSKYVMESRGEKAKELVAFQQQLQANQEQVQFVQRQLRELAAGSSKTERDAVIVVDKRNPAAGKVRLNYLVDQASWRPQYKLRAGKDEKDPVQLEYLGAIVQQTGEDWSNVNLVLSTAQPMLNAAPPELRMLEVAVMHRGGGQGGGGMQGQGAGRAGLQNQPPGAVPAPDAANQTLEAVDKQRIDLRNRAHKEFNEKQEGPGTTPSNQAAALKQARELAAFEPQAKSGKRSPTAREGPSFPYPPPPRLTVPSRNDEQVLEVARIDL